MSSVSYGQIKIKEKVEIKPSTNILQMSSLNKTTISHLLELKLTWTGEPDVLLTGELFEKDYHRPSLDVVYRASGGTVILSSTITEFGNYSYSISFGNQYGHERSANLKIEICLNGTVVEVRDVGTTSRTVGIFTISEPICGDDAPECDGEPEAPTITTKNAGPKYSYCDEPGYENRRGGFSKSWNWPYTPISVSACFNAQTDSWQFQIDGNEVTLEYYLTVCYENINSMYTKLISSPNDLYEIPKGDFCLAIKNFDAQKKYGGGENPYYIVEATVKHEERHRDDYIEELNELKNKHDLPNKLVEYKPNCNEIDNYNDALQKGAENIRDKLKNFLQKFELNWRKMKDSHASYEQYTQDRIINIVDDYIKQLEAIHGLKKENCK